MLIRRSTPAKTFLLPGTEINVCITIQKNKKAPVNVLTNRGLFYLQITDYLATLTHEACGPLSPLDSP